MGKQYQTRWNCNHCGASGWWTPSTHIWRSPYVDHDTPNGSPCIASLPIETVAKCKRCGHSLGAQNDGDTCGFCKFATIGAGQ